MRIATVNGTERYLVFNIMLEKVEPCPIFSSRLTTHSARWNAGFLNAQMWGKDSHAATLFRILLASFLLRRLQDFGQWIGHHCLRIYGSHNYCTVCNNNSTAWKTEPNYDATIKPFYNFHQYCRVGPHKGWKRVRPSAIYSCFNA